ncbi:MAG: mechanosensitive ion channel family protein [Longimicrobiales bacterium]
MPQSFGEQLNQGITEIGEFFPRLAAAVGILMVGFLIAKMAERGTDAALHRIGFDRWMREGGVTEALERAGTTLDPSTVIARLVFWTVMLLVMILAGNALGVAAVSVLFGELLSYIPSVIAAVIVLVLGILLGEFVKDLILASAGGLPAAPTLARAAKAAIILLAAFMALEQLDIAEDIVLVFFIAVVGAAALAAGIAFGLGGREVAAEIAREWYERNRRRPDRRRIRKEPENPPPPADSAPPFSAAPPSDSRE